MLTWNGGNCCGEAFERGVDDVGFVGRLLDRLPSLLPVDRRRIHATGMSNGAMMAHRVAAELAGRIASIAPVAGPLALPAIAPLRPVPVLGFHGTLDQFTPWEGGVGRRSVTRTDHRAIVDGMMEWVRANRLGPAVTRTTVPCADAGFAIERLAWGRPDEAEVVLYRIDGAGHTWPGRVPDSFYLGSSIADLNAAWMRASACGLSASKRVTTTGVVFDARARPKPSGYSTRTPSMVITSSEPSNFALR